MVGWVERSEAHILDCHIHFATYVPPRAKCQGVRSYPIHQCSDVDNHVCEHASVVFPVFCELLDIWTHVLPVQKLPQAAVIGRKLLPETTLRRPTIGDFT